MWKRNMKSFPNEILNFFFRKNKDVSTYKHINDILYNEIWVVEEWVELFCNLWVLSVDLATSSDSYKCELKSVLAAIYSCSASYYLTSFFQNMFNKSETGLIKLQVGDVSLKSYAGYK